MSTEMPHRLRNQFRNVEDVAVPRPVQYYTPMATLPDGTPVITSSRRVRVKERQY